MKFRNSRGKNNCMVFNKNNNSDHICELLKMQLESRSRNVHLRGPVAGSFQHTLWPSERAEGCDQIFSELQYFGPDLRLAWTKTAISIWSVQNADCRPQTADRRPGKRCRLGTKCRPQIKCRLRIYTVFFRLIRDNMSSYNLPSVMLFGDHLSQLLALLWNIPCPFLDHNHSS